MAVSYTWDVKTVNTYKSHTDEQDPANTRSDVIFNVHWVLKGGDDPYQDPWQADYGKLTPVLVKAVQELKAELDAAKARITTLESA